jgi:hypothetical protein
MKIKEMKKIFNLALVLCGFALAAKGNNLIANHTVPIKTGEHCHYSPGTCSITSSGIIINGYWCESTH